MTLEVLAENVKRLRNVRRLSQPNLAKAADVSVPTIKNLESSRGEPRMRTLQAIARALEVPLRDLFLPVRKLRTVRFRSKKRMQNRANILADVATWLDEFNFLEELLDDKLQYRLKNIRTARSRDGIIRVAHKCREQLGLDPDEPIHDICGLLEHGGIKVYPVNSSSDGFFGLSVSAHDGGPAVVVNTWDRIPIERQIFSAAHELGHLVLHKDAFDVEITEEDKDEEKQADLFAGHFLMPDDGFVKEWNEAAGLHLVDRVFKVKGIFHVSYKTVLHRIIELGAADKSIWMRFNVACQQRFGKKLAYKEEPAGTEHAEPFGLDQFDFYEDRFSRLTRRAVEGDEITMSRGAEILRIPVEEMRDLMRNWEVVL